VNCQIGKPFTGEIIIDKTEFPIKSIEIQLVRVETCGWLKVMQEMVNTLSIISYLHTNISIFVLIPLQKIIIIIITLFCPLVSEFKQYKLAKENVCKGLPIPIFMILQDSFMSNSLYSKFQNR